MENRSRRTLYWEGNLTTRYDIEVIGFSGCGYISTDMHARMSLAKSFASLSGLYHVRTREDVTKREIGYILQASTTFPEQAEMRLVVFSYRAESIELSVNLDSEYAGTEIRISAVVGYELNHWRCSLYLCFVRSFDGFVYFGFIFDDAVLRLFLNHIEKCSLIVV